MRAEWALLTPPTVEPITLDEAKLQARIVTDDENALVDSYRKTAREAAEAYLQRGLLTQTWQLTLDRFYDEMWLPMAAPLQSVTAVTYYDVTGVVQTVTPTVYTVDLVSRPGRVCLAAGQVWPSVQSLRLTSRVTLTYVVGWTSPYDVPERIKQGIRLYLAACYGDREGLDVTAALAAARSCWDDQVYWKEPCAQGS